VTIVFECRPQSKTDKQFPGLLWSTFFELLPLFHARPQHVRATSLIVLDVSHRRIRSIPQLYVQAIRSNGLRRRALSVILGVDNSRVDTAFEVNRRNSPVRYSVTPCPSASGWRVFRRQRLERVIIIHRHCGRCFRGAATNSQTWCYWIRILSYLQRSCRGEWLGSRSIAEPNS